MSDNEEKRINALFNKYYSDETINVSIENDVSGMIGFMDSINDIKSCNYFRLLSKMKIEKFYESQYLFNDAINNWSKALGLLVYKVPETSQRQVIVRNLIDENNLHGHVGTFELLKRIILSHYPGCKSSNNSEYHIMRFNKELNESVWCRSWYFSVAMCGAIEYTYVTISRLLREYLLTKIPKDEIVHYTEHETLDVTHASEFFSLISYFFNYTPYELEISNEISKKYRDEITRGMIHGYNMMYTLYNGLYDCVII